VKTNRSARGAALESGRGGDAAESKGGDPTKGGPNGHHPALGDAVEMIHETYGHVTPKMRAAAVERLAVRLAAPPGARVRSVGESDSVAGGEGPET
jgi:hypothetical protein